MSAKPPVLVMSWRRPDSTARVLAALADWRPDRLFLTCDGPDAEAPGSLTMAVEETRALLDRAPEWPCEVRRRYFATNLGLRRAVPAAIDWFFAHCDEGIILEDDCVPTLDFLEFASDLLDRYRGSPSVMAVVGDNSRGVRLSGSSSYGFVRYASPWGWATWARAWRQYDPTAERASSLTDAEWAARLPDPVERRVWRERTVWLNRSSGGNVWNMRWALSIVSSGGVVAQPHANLIQNIGFGPDATHTVSAPPGLLDTGAIFPLVHPTEVVIDELASRDTFDRVFGGLDERRRAAWERSVRGRIRRLIHGAALKCLPASLLRLVGRVPRRSPWNR